MTDAARTICDQVADIGDRVAALLAAVVSTPRVAPCGGPEGLPTDDRLRALLVGLEAVRNATEAAQAETMAAMAREAQALDRSESASGMRGHSHEEFTSDEIAALLSCTTVAAAHRYETACRVAALHPVRHAWRTGRIDGRKAALICEQVDHLAPSTRDRVSDDAVGYGSTHTVPQLRAWLRRRVIAADPHAAEERRRRAVADRRVVVMPRDDGVSELWALLPSVDARRIQLALTAAASALGADDARTMDQRRADIAVDLLLGRKTPPSVELRVVVSEASLEGRSGDPAEVAGLGAVTSGELAGLGIGLPATEQITQQVTWRRLVTDPMAGTLIELAEKRYRPSAALERHVRARDVTCRFPGCRRSADAAGTDLDHTVPFPAGETSAGNLAVLCRRHHRLKHQAGWSVSLAADGVMTWTTPSGRTLETHPWQYTDPPPDDS